MSTDQIIINPSTNDTELAELAEPHGGVDAILEKLRLFRQASSRLTEAWPSLMENYPDKWVSMDADGHLTVEDSLEDLITTHAALGIHSAELPCKFLDTSPVSLVL